MSWICPKCETENSERLKICEVCDTPREKSPVDELKSKLKEKYSDAAYKAFIRYHYSLLASADQGNSIDQYKVGEWFFNKHSADCYKIAAIWFLEAAKQGHMEAQAKLALCYENGYGVPKSKDAAIKWYEEAANKGDVTARQQYLKLRYASKTYDAVIRYRMKLLLAANNGNRNSQYQLGEWFSSHQSQPSHREEAFSWYEKAAKSGHSAAMYKLGECYEKGIGINCNTKESLKWYRKAAENGIADAQYLLGIKYKDGIDVPQNISEATRWLQKAADNGHESAKNALQTIKTPSNPPSSCLKEGLWILFALLIYLLFNCFIIFVVSLIPELLRKLEIAVPNNINHYLEYINIDTSPVSTIIIGIVIAHIIIIYLYKDEILK